VGGGSNVDDFFTSASARTAYKNHLKVVTSRKNTINGKVGAAPTTLLTLSTHLLQRICQTMHLQS